MRSAIPIARITVLWKMAHPVNLFITCMRSFSGKASILGTNPLHKLKTASWIMLQTAALLTSYVRARVWWGVLRGQIMALSTEMASVIKCYGTLSPNRTQFKFTVHWFVSCASPAAWACKELPAWLPPAWRLTTTLSDIRSPQLLDTGASVSWVSFASSSTLYLCPFFF